MRALTQLLGIGAVAYASTSLGAQARPDFSGRWTVSPSDARVSGMGSGWASTITIAQDTNRLVVEYPFFVPMDMQPPLRFVYALDGSETRTTLMMGRGIQTQTSHAAWQGERLVLTTIVPFTDPESGRPASSTVTRTLSLVSPTTLLVETVFGGALGGPPTSTRTSYQKL